MTIIEVDGVNHIPLTVDRFTIFAGQRYSVVVCTTFGPENSMVDFV